MQVRIHNLGYFKSYCIPWEWNPWLWHCQHYAVWSTKRLCPKTLPQTESIQKTIWQTNGEMVLLQNREKERNTKNNHIKPALLIICELLLQWVIL